MNLTFSCRPPETFDRYYDIGIVAGRGFDPGPEFREVMRREYESYNRHGQPLWVVALDQDREEQQEVAFVSSVFLHDWAADELLKATVPYVHPKFLAWLDASKSPYVIGDEVGKANASGGLNHLTVQFGWDRSLPESEATLVRSSILLKYIEYFSGFRLKRMMMEVYDPTTISHCENAGLKVRNRYEDWKAQDGNYGPTPVLYTMDRSESIAGDNAFMIRLFAYQEPKFRLPESQRELLQLARFDSTDEWLADQLSISVHAVKKRWQAIYSRIDEVMPGLLPVTESDVRGKGKKRVLMSYIQNNPSELWPYLP